MMKWSNKHRGSISSSDEGSEDIRRSIEELDKVLDEFDDFSPKVKKKHGIGSSVKHKSKEKCDTSNVNPKLDPVRQSLDILDTVLAQYEAELIDTKEKDVLSESFEDSFEESTEIDRFLKGDDAETVESRGSDDNLASPTSTKQGRKISPPPVPKRSPTTCLSCSSSFECPSPETLENHREFFSESNSNLESIECSLHSKIDSKYKKKSLYRKKLSSKPVRKGSDRPKVKANDSATSQDDLSDDDDVFTVFGNFADLNKDEMIEAADKNKTRNGESEKLNISAKSFSNSKEKFAFAKYLIKEGLLEGLDEDPPSFKPPPIPLPPKTKINKNKKQIQPKDTNGNEINNEFNEVNEFVINKSVQKQTNSESLPQPHVTSVKINQNSTTNSTQIHSNSNVSVITIQPKITTTNDKNTSNVKTATKPAIPPKEKNQKTSPQQQQSPQLNRNGGGGPQRVALSTFTRSTSNNNSKSSSLEDVCSSNNGRTQKAVVIADQLGMTKTGSLPLELKKPSVPTGGAVFFNVFQPDGEKLTDDTSVVDDKTKDDKEIEKKRGWKKKKKSKDKSKDSTTNSNESIKGSNSTSEQNALLAELTGKIQTKKSATPNGSSSDDSDQGRNQRTEQLDKAPNAKDDKDKGIWKGFWKKKQSPAPET